MRSLDKLPKMSSENWKDAEAFAEKLIRWLGFPDAKVTSEGSDEGKDVDSRQAVTQVKDIGAVVSRPIVQQLNGVAAAERKIPVFLHGHLQPPQKMGRKACNGAFPAQSKRRS